MNRKLLVTNDCSVSLCGHVNYVYQPDIYP